LIRANSRNGYARNLTAGMTLNLPVYQKDYRVSIGDAWAAGSEIKDILLQNQSLSPSMVPENIARTAGMTSPQSMPQPTQNATLGISSPVRGSAPIAPVVELTSGGNTYSESDAYGKPTASATYSVIDEAERTALGLMQQADIVSSFSNQAMQVMKTYGFTEQDIAEAGYVWDGSRYKLQYGSQENSVQLDTGNIGNTTSEFTDVAQRQYYQWQPWGGKMSISKQNLARISGPGGGGGGGAASYGGAPSYGGTTQSGRSIYASALQGLINWRIVG